MAQSTYTVKVQVESSGAIANLEEIDNTLKAGNSNLIQMRQELKAIQSELLGLEPGTEKFVELAGKAGELRDRMKDVSESINANAAPAIESLGNNFALLGNKLSNLDFQGAAESLRAIGGNLSRVSFKDLIAGAKSFGSALASVGKALLTNPIFLIGAAIAAAVVYSKELLSLVDGITAEDEKLLANQKERAQLSKEQLDTISAQENILKLQGKSEKEILQLKIEASKVAIADLEAQLLTQKQLKESQVEAAKRNKDILSGIIQFVALPLQAILFTIDKIAEFAGFDTNLRDQLNDFVSSAVFDPEEVAAEADATIKETEKALETLKNQQAGFQLSIKQIDKAAADERQKQRDDEQDKIDKAEADRLQAKLKTEQAIKDAQNDRLNQEEEIQEKIFQATLSAQEREIQAVRDQYFELITLAEQNGLDAQALLDEQLAKEAEIKEKYRKEEEAKAAENEAKEKAKQQQIDQFKIDSLSGTLSALAALNEAFVGDSEKAARRAFNINKAISLAQAVQSTYTGATKAYASQIIPGDPSSLVRGQVAAGIVVAAGLANVAKIAASKFNPSGGGGGGGGGGLGAGPRGGGAGGGFGGQPDPAFNPLNTEFLQNRPGQTPPPRAYVLAGDVASTQEATEKINALSTL